jgi:hypothetical protein
MRTCDFCGNEIKSYGTLTWSPVKGSIHAVDVCDLCGSEIMDSVKENIQKHREAMKESEA